MNVEVLGDLWWSLFDNWLVDNSTCCGTSWDVNDLSLSLGHSSVCCSSSSSTEAVAWNQRCIITTYSLKQRANDVIPTTTNVGETKCITSWTVATVRASWARSIGVSSLALKLKTNVWSSSNNSNKCENLRRKKRVSNVSECKLRPKRLRTGKLILKWNSATSCSVICLEIFDAINLQVQSSTKCGRLIITLKSLNLASSRSCETCWHWRRPMKGKWNRVNL